MKYLLIITAVVLFIVLVIVIIGFLLPVKHTAHAEVLVNASPESVWQKLTDFKNYPQWRKNLKSVEAGSATSWIETDKNNNRLPLEIITEDPLKKLTIKINGKNLPFGGTWIFTLEKKGNQTIVTITENGEVYNPVFRFVSRFIMGYSASINQYAKDLETAFN